MTALFGKAVDMGTNTRIRKVYKVIEKVLRHTGVCTLFRDMLNE